jgi:CRP/FNR family transcriptional regulator, cyclic AMP receptor protein
MSNATHYPVLRQNPWFSGLPTGLQYGLIAASETRRLRDGEMLFRQGDALPEDGGVFFAVLDGNLKFSNLREDGREAILAVLEPGNWFGEITLLDRLPRTHDATALGPSQVLALPRDAFNRLMLDSVFSQAVCRLLAGRLRLLYGMLEDAAMRSTRARVARRLILLAYGGAAHDQEQRRVVSVSQESLAMMLGITRQTLSKELKSLAHSGALALGYGRIDIVSMPQLLKQGEQTEPGKPQRRNPGDL